MKIWPVILAAGVGVAASISNPATQEDKTIYDEDVELVRPATMEYPGGMFGLPAVVVVRVRLGHNGRVTGLSPFGDWTT